jgi:hypothetical protein
MHLTFLFALLSLVSASSKVADNSTMIFFIFREDCFNKFMNKEFTDQECLKVTISKGIGFAIVAGSSILKLPQILKIVSNGSVEGLAAMSQYIEVSQNHLIKCADNDLHANSRTSNLEEHSIQCLRRVADHHVSKLHHHFTRVELQQENWNPREDCRCSSRPGVCLPTLWHSSCPNRRYVVNHFQFQLHPE